MLPMTRFSSSLLKNVPLARNAPFKRLLYESKVSSPCETELELAFCTPCGRAMVIIVCGSSRSMTTLYKGMPLILVFSNLIGLPPLGAFRMRWSVAASVWIAGGVKNWTGASEGLGSKNGGGRSKETSSALPGAMTVSSGTGGVNIGGASSLLAITSVCAAGGASATGGAGCGAHALRIDAASSGAINALSLVSDRCTKGWISSA
jgi:hypothetical protein